MKDTPTMTGPGIRGVFLERTTFEREVEERLVAIDSVTVHDQLVQERCISIDNLKSSIVDMNGLFANLSNIVKLQQEQVDSLDSNLSAAHEQTEAAVQSITRAAALQKKSACLVS